MTVNVKIMVFWDVLPSPTTDKYKYCEGHLHPPRLKQGYFKIYNTWKSLDEYLANIKNIKFWFNMF